MKIIDVLQYSDLDDLVKKLEATKEKSSTDKVKDFKKEWDIESHKIMVDKNYLPDKDIVDSKGNLIRQKMVNRIALGYQKLIVNRTVAFGFANSVDIDIPKQQLEDYPDIITAVKRVLYENKESTFNRKIARDLYRSTEVSEIWYVQKGDKPHNRYGFETPYSLGVMNVSGWNDNNLFTVFNEYNGMILFARSYITMYNGKKTSTFQIWTDEEMLTINKPESKWEVVEQKPNPFNKIPIVYASQEHTEWHDIKYEIQRLELLLSRHAEINDYHAAPKTFVKGTLKSTPQAGEANGILNGETDSEVQILSWKDSPESIKLEIETRLDNIHKFTQMPDVTLKSIKGLGQISGTMLKMFFMDAHLKVMEKNEIWEEYFTRRYNVIKSILSFINVSSNWNEIHEEVEMTPIIRPYMIQDTKELVEIAVTANGGKAIIDREGAIKITGLVKNTKDTLDLIEKEEEQDYLKTISEPQLY